MKFLVAALLVGSSVAAFASTGSLSAVQGNVIVSSGKTSSKATPGAVLKDGDLIFVASGSSAMIQVAKCSISLTAGQSLVVNSTLPCVELSASVKSTVLPKTVVAADADDANQTLFWTAGIVGGGLLLNEFRKSRNTNSSTPTPAGASRT